MDNGKVVHTHRGILSNCEENEFMTLPVRCVELENVKSEATESQKRKPCMLSQEFGA